MILASILLPVVATQGQTAESFVYGAIRDASLNRWRSFSRKVEGARWDSAAEEALKVGLQLSAASDIKTTSKEHLNYTLVTATYKIGVQGKLGTVRETIMVKNYNGWMITPPKTKPENGLINYAAYMLVNGRKDYENEKADASRKSALSSAKLLSLSLLLYATDNRWKLPSGSWQTSISKYVKDPEIFTPTGVQKSDWSFNSNLWGKDPLDYDDDVVIVYVGSFKALTYKFDGKGLVGFMDGSARFVTRTEASKLKWK